MSKEIENVNVEEVETTIEETKEGFKTKAGRFLKKNGKKIVAGVAIAGGIGLIYALGKNTNVVSNDVIDDVTDIVTDEATDVVTDL